MERPIEIIERWQDEGRWHVSPAEAAKVMHADPQAIRRAWFVWGKASGFEAFMTGRNLRITVDSLARLVGGGESGIRWPGIKKDR